MNEHSPQVPVPVPPVAEATLAVKSGSISVNTTAEPREIVRFALGANEPLPGEVIDREEERRRLIAEQFELNRKAKKLGLTIKQIEPFPAYELPSTLAQQITKAAAPLMTNAAQSATVVYQKYKAKQGSDEVEITNFKINLFAGVGKVMKGLSDFLASKFKGKASMSIKVGKQGVDVKVNAEVDQE